MTSMQAISGASRRVASRKLMVGIYWAFHTALAAMVALPLMGAAVSVLSHSRYATEIMRGFDVMWLFEALSASRNLPSPMVLPLFLLALLLAVKGGVFLNGGAVKLLVHDEIGYSPREFYEGCGRNYWRFLRLMLYSLFFYGFALAIGASITKAAGKIWGEGLEERPLVFAGYLKNAVQILLCGFVATAMDYAKVRLVADDSRQSLRAAFGSVRLAWKNKGTVMGVWLVLLLLWAAATLVYVQVANRIQAVTIGSILALIAWQQLYVLSRVWLRMTSWGAAAELDPVLRPRQMPPEETAPVLVEVAAGPPVLEAGAEAEPEAGTQQ
ncbi:MAG: hypothetical protein HY858_00105 [Candidatus Solibacter usitatus]|nr:hypothetical protein [Candidatus Solibacter usitatus]